MKKKLLIATGNPGKFQEILLGLKPLIDNGLQVFSLADLKIKNKLDESGQTFKENAVMKARFFSGLAHLPTIGDDAGIVIPYLNNEPGVRSRRWPGYEAGDEELIAYTLKKLDGIENGDRTAYLVLQLCFFDPKTGKTIYQSGKIKGRIAKKTSSKRIKGYPYRSLFIVDKFDKYYDELTEKEHHKINHRIKAITQLTKKIKDLL